MVAKNCEGCGKPLVRRTSYPHSYEAPSRFAARRFCDRACLGRMSSRLRKGRDFFNWKNTSSEDLAERRAERVSEIKWLAGTDIPERIATRVGFNSVDSMFTFLERENEHPLASRLRAQVWRPDSGWENRGSRWYA